MTDGPVGGMRRALIAVVALAAVSTGCFGKPKHPMPVPEPILLDIDNQGFSDVDVYVMPSPTLSGEIRLGMVSGFSKRAVRVRSRLLQPGLILQLDLHAIGGFARWISPAMAVRPGEHVVLQINTDATGNLNQSMLYVLPDTGGG